MSSEEQNEVFEVRHATKDDANVIISLMKEFHVFQKLSPDSVVPTSEDLLNDAFSDESSPVCYFLILESTDGKKETIGFAHYFYFYSTLRKKSLYLEDIFVQQKYRGKGLGKLIFGKLYEICRSRGCGHVMLDAVPEAVGFYENLGLAKRKTHTPMMIAKDKFP